MKILAAAIASALALHAADLKPGTAEAFNAYVHKAEAKLDARPSFLWCSESPARAARARKGEVVAEPTSGGKPESKLPDGLAHDWTGCVFVPDATLPEVIRFVKDYNGHKEKYRAVLLDSKLRRQNGEEFQVYMRMFKKKIITVVLDSETEVRYQPIDATHEKSHSWTTSISEVENAGKRDEKVLPPGTGHGFLWRLDSFWRFEQADGGVWVECQAISLTRDVPAGLGWLIEPIIRNMPRESLALTLTAIRENMLKRPH